MFRQGKEELAFNTLVRINRKEKAEKELLAIKEMVEQESGSIRQLLYQGLRIALILGIILAILQQITGINAVLYYAPEIFKNLGYGTETALLQTVILGLVNLLFTFFAIWTVDLLGRRLLMVIGASRMGIALILIGI